MSLSRADLPPSLPCVVCRRLGWVERDGLHYGCDRCRGFGIIHCTMEDVRGEYERMRRLICTERGMFPRDVDAMVRKRVERAKHMNSNLPAAIWFDVIYYLGREFDVLEKWWTIQQFGRK